MKSTLLKPLAIVVLLLLTDGFSLVACQQNKKSTGTAPAESEVKVGWTAGPTRRGTLTLLWGCLSTIFASTWTVLHLNVPHPDESRWVTAGRKVKWMAITVLFPEFIFSKAVCELRQAVADLQYMHVAMKKTPLKWKDTVPAYDGLYAFETHRSISWEVDFNTRMRSLYRLFGLPALPPASASEDEEMKSFKHSPADNDGNRSPIRSSGAGTSTDGVPDVGRDASGDRNPSAPASMSMYHDGRLSLDDTPTQEPHGGGTDLGSEGLGKYGEGTGNNTEYGAETTAAQQTSDIPDSAPVGEQDSQTKDTAQSPFRLLRRGMISPSSISEVPVYTLRPEKRYWTLSHSIYANMGGMVYRASEIYIEIEPIRPLTAHTLARSIEHHLPDIQKLKDLVLDEKDIKDKSKVDWLLKTIAVLQIGWLILNAGARAATGLPVTQLEVATGAFAVIAIATFVTNWWKPKDVSRPTLLSLSPAYFSTDAMYRSQSFARRILYPSKSKDELSNGKLKRISNDTILIDGKPPLALVLIALSSMIFGGLHGLAWNSEFSSKAELVLWRTSVVVAAALPVATLIVTFLIEHLATSFITSWTSFRVAKLFAHLDRVPLKHWNQLRQEPEFLSWPLELRYAFLEKLSQRPPESDFNWEDKPAPPDNLPPDTEKIVQRHQLPFKKASYALEKLATVWVESRSNHSGIQKVIENVLYLCHTSWAKDPELFSMQWRQYESYLRSKIPDLKPELNEFCVRDFVASKLEEFDSLQRKDSNFRKRCDLVSQYFVIGNCIIYATARIVTLALVFSSLRSVSDKVYDDVLWTRFLPKFS